MEPVRRGARGASRISLVVTVMLGVVAFLVALGCATAPGPDEVRMVLPVGDPELGRDAWRALRCGACHDVAGEPDLGLARKIGPAPTLVRGNPERSAGEWASAIVAPAHEASWSDPENGDPTADMPAYYDRMTVGQLMDLVSFLERDS